MIPPELEGIGMPNFVFVIDTKKYAGNFERELCAYVTGIIGECEVGDEEAKEFAQDHSGDNPFEEIIEMPPDDNGCHRPVMLWSTPGWFNHGMGGCFTDGQEIEAREDHRQACLKEAEKKPYTNHEANKTHKKKWEARADEPLTKHHAYMSVGICFAKLPSNKLIKLMIQRARAFSKKKITFEFDGKSDITGFRMIEINVVVTEDDISRLF